MRQYLYGNFHSRLLSKKVCYQPDFKCSCLYVYIKITMTHLVIQHSFGHKEQGRSLLIGKRGGQRPLKFVLTRERRGHKT